MQGNAYNYDCSTLSEVKSRMLNENIDVFCLQEAGNFFNLISSEKWSKIYPEYDFYVARNIQIGTTSRGIPVNIYYVAFGTVNMRCSGTAAKSCVKNFRDREKTRILAFTERCKYERDPVYYFGTVYSAAGV